MFLRATLENPEDILYGGRNNKLAEIIETFLQKICDAGAKLVFFQSYFKRQPTNSENEMTDTEPLQYRDRTEHFKLYADILRKIDNNESIDVARCNLRTLLGFDYESIAKKYGELHTSSLLRHIEIINYAKKHRNVLAILAKDSNFLMFDFHPTQYWLCGKRYLKLDELKVRNLDINKLNDHLGLSKLQKAVFGAILVTYYKNTRADVLSSLAKADRFFSEENFQKIFGKPEDKVSVRMILLTVHYVRTSENFSDQVLALQPPNTSKIVSDIFDDNANERLEEILKIRYNNYSEFRPIANETNDDEIVLYREFAKNDQFVFNVLCSKTIGFFSTSFTFIDFTQWNGDAKSYVNLILPIIKKNMGIVLQHRGDETITCKIALPNYHAQFFPNEYEAAIYPESNLRASLFSILAKLCLFNLIFVFFFLSIPVTVPDLHQLIFTSDNEDDVVLTDIKWRLLLWTLSIDLDVSMIDDLQHKLKSVVLTLIFLRQVRI